MLSPSVRKRLIVVTALIFCVVIAAAVRFGSVTKANSEAPALVPTITATNVDSLFTDVDGDGRADPGDTILYTVTINNAGTDASNMVFTSTLDANTTLVGGSLNSSPIAGSDTYSVTGNVSISVPDGGSDLLNNDVDPDTGNNTGLTATIETKKSTQCTAAGAACSANNVSINANGSFTFDPPAGFEGADSFTYTVTDASGGSGTGTVTLNVSGMVWFINNNAAACTAAGCGRLSNPFSTLAAFAALNNGTSNNPSTNDNIFVFESATTYTGPVTLLNGQKLIGQDSTASLQTLTALIPPSHSTAYPAMNIGGNATTISNSGAAAINLNGTGAGGLNYLNGFTVGNSNPGIAGTNFGTVAFGSVIVNSNGQALSLSTGTVVVPTNYLGFTSVTSTGGTNGIALTSIGGTVNLASGALSGATGTTFLVSGGTATTTYSGNITQANPAAMVSVSGVHTGR